MCKLGREEAIKQLLHNGAHLDERAVQLILPSTLESFLDSCIRESAGVDTAEDFSVTFDYSFLNLQQKQQPECAILRHLCLSAKHRNLLNHPLLTSFLMLKWHSIRSLYYVNLAVYSLHVIFLTIYTLLHNSHRDFGDAMVR